MLAPIISRNLTIAADPVARTARIQLPVPDRDEPGLIKVLPDRTGEGWTILGPTEQNASWRVTFEAALTEATQTAARLLGECLRHDARGLGLVESPGARGRPDVC